MKILLIFITAILPGCVTLSVDTKYGAIGIGTDGESVNFGFTPR